jgi:FdhD protein
MQHAFNGNRGGAARRTVARHRPAPDGAGYSPDSGVDHIAEEVPVALVFNGISHAVMMCTPTALAALGAGFALTEGIVPDVSEIYDIEVLRHADGAEVQMTISQQAFHALKGRRRTLAGRSGCGVCGVESLALLDLQPERVAPEPVAPPYDAAAAVARAGRALPDCQALMWLTGGVHAAAWCDADGAVLAACEDVGRHNALDKLIGQLALDGKTAALRDGFVLMSSRASYELVRKAARMGIPMLAAISAPSTLAIDMAHRAGMRLFGFCRQGGCVEY